jgi:hypothetical protein
MVDLLGLRPSGGDGDRGGGQALAADGRGAPDRAEHGPSILLVDREARVYHSRAALEHVSCTDCTNGRPDGW